MFACALPAPCMGGAATHVLPQLSPSTTPITPPFAGAGSGYILLDAATGCRMLAPCRASDAAQPFAGP